MKVSKINSLVYLVNKHWTKLQVIPPTVRPARIIGYQRIEGEIFPILKQGNLEVSPLSFNIFTDLEEAVNSIRKKK